MFLKLFGTLRVPSDCLITLQAEDIEPVLRRFRNSWATEYLAKEAFSSHKSYEFCKGNDETYRGKHRRTVQGSARGNPSPNRDPTDEDSHADLTDRDPLDRHQIDEDLDANDMSDLDTPLGSPMSCMDE